MFGRDLADKYERLAVRESDAGHTFNADYFRGKSQAAMAGAEIVPDQPKSVSLATVESRRLNDAYIRLTQALGKGAGRLQPNAAANAQVAYDCWVAEYDRRHPMRATNCRAAFEQNIRSIESAVAVNEPALSILPVVPVYKVFVRQNADSTVADAGDTLDLAAQDYSRFHPAAVIVKAGNGQTAYADAVARALAARGVPAEIVRVKIIPGRRVAYRGHAHPSTDNRTITIEFST